jgi:hypothetical protein
MRGSVRAATTPSPRNWVGRISPGVARVGVVPAGTSRRGSASGDFSVTVPGTGSPPLAGPPVAGWCRSGFPCSAAVIGLSPISGAVVLGGATWTMLVVGRPAGARVASSCRPASVRGGAIVGTGSCPTRTTPSGSVGAPAGLVGATSGTGSCTTTTPLVGVVGAGRCLTVVGAGMPTTRAAGT